MKICRVPPVRSRKREMSLCVLLFFFSQIGEKTLCRIYPSRDLFDRAIFPNFPGEFFGKVSKHRHFPRPDKCNLSEAEALRYPARSRDIFSGTLESLNIQRLVKIFVSIYPFYDAICVKIFVALYSYLNRELYIHATKVRGIKKEKRY